MRPKASALATELKEEWNAMSKEERDEATKDAKMNLVELRDMKKHATHNVSINAFHDARATLASIESQVRTVLCV